MCIEVCGNDEQYTVAILCVVLVCWEWRGVGSSRVHIVGNRREYLRQSLAEALHLKKRCSL